MGTLDALRTWNQRNDLDQSDVEADGERMRRQSHNQDHADAGNITREQANRYDVNEARSVGDRLRRSAASARPGRVDPLFIATRPRADRYVFVLLRDLTALDAEAGRVGRAWYEGKRETLTVDEGSDWINRLKAKIEDVKRNPGKANVVESIAPAPKPKANVWAEWRAIAGELAGMGGTHGARFAIDTEPDAVNRIAFWWISPGRMEGRYNIRQVIGGQGPVYVRMGPEAMVAIGRKIIAAGAEDAMRRYGREIGECGHCGRTLTNDASRAAGIGPVCAVKH